MAILKEKVGLTNEDLRKLRSLHPGMNLDLQVKTPTAVKRVRTEFVGMDGTRFLIMKYPDEAKWGNLRDGIYTDNHMIVRFILEDEAGEIIAFKSKVILVLSKPANLVFLSFPLAIQSHGLRSEKRAQTHIAMKILSENGTELAVGHILDISNSGCRIGFDRTRHQAGLKVREMVRVMVKNPGEGPVELPAQVMNAKNDEGHFYHGLKFEKSAEEVEKLLEQLMIVY